MLGNLENSTQIVTAAKVISTKKYTNNCRGSASVPALNQSGQPRGDCPYRYFIYKNSPKTIMLMFSTILGISLGLQIGLAIVPAIASADASANNPDRPPSYINKRVCPSNFPDLSKAIAKDLQGYLTRTYTRLGFKSQVVAVGYPEVEPLPLAAGNRAIITNSVPDANKAITPTDDPKQLFISLLERPAGKLDTTKKAYWLFLTNTRRGWRLAMAFTRIGNSPPQDVSDGAIADAVRTWLRDYCDQNTLLP
jgi:hypothetical protein